MAIINFDIDKQKIYIIVERQDTIRTVEEKTVETTQGGQYDIGKVFIDGPLEVCVIRGERNK